MPLPGLSSKTLTLGLLAALVGVLIPVSLGGSPLFLSTGRLLLAALAINLGLCTVTHWRRLTPAVLLTHVGVLVVLAGALLSHAGFIATVNISQGATTRTAFRWDHQEDQPLGFALTVKEIHHDYYPVPVRIGVLVDGKPTKLYELRTGEEAWFAGHRLEAISLQPDPATLRVAITTPDGIRQVQLVDRESRSNRPGIAIQLVAFQTPTIKRSWVDLEIAPEGAASVYGQAEVNHPFCWQGLRFFHTATGRDAAGQAYAGIQIVNDQGIPLVYGGFGLIGLGGWLLALTKIGSRRSGHNRHATRA